MYKTLSQVPSEEMEKIKNNCKAWGLIIRDVSEEDFKAISCYNGKKLFTKENLILEIDKIHSMPDYTLLPSKLGDIHIIWYGRSSLSEFENEKLCEIFKYVFGIENYF